MKLHLDKNLFVDAIKITSQQLNIPPIFIEKDYWVTYTLHTIFHNPIGTDTVFKGGTALSKCFGLIERFSEDIDLVVIRQDGEANNKLTQKIKKISKIVSAVLPEVEISNVTRKMGMNRKTAHSYTKEFKGDYGQIRDVIVVEASWLGYYEPYTTKKVSSFIYEMMMNAGQEKLAAENGMHPFEVQVLEPKRTLCEKIMSLVRFSYTKNPINDLKNKVRHTYDLYQMLNDNELSIFFESNEFDKMLVKVANDDVKSFKNNNTWLQHHPTKAKIFEEIEIVWEELKPVYSGEFKDLVFGNQPSENEIFESLESIKRRLESVEWTITIENSTQINRKNTIA